MSLTELRLDSEEFTKLLNQATRNRVKNALISAKAEVDREIVTLELKQKQAAEKDATASTGAKPKRLLTELYEYAWDQSDKFVKLYINLDGVQNLAEENVHVKFTAHTMELLVEDLNNKNYGLTITNLLNKIDVEKSYRKIKTNMIAIYLKKQEEGKHWEDLTKIMHQLQRKQEEEEKHDNEHPETALFDMMKKMYKTGSPESRKMIAKAFAEVGSKGPQ